MGKALKDGGDVKEWARQYPWITAGSAAAVGFVVGMLITPSKSNSLKAKYQELKDALTPKPTAEELAAALANEKRKSDKPSLLSNLFGQLTKSIGPIIAGMASGAMAQPDTNGAPQAPPASAPEAAPEGFGVYRDQRYAHS
jgi:gas vesicle protein